MDSFILNYNEELIYEVKKKKKLTTVIKKKARKQTQIEPCKNCGNADKKLFKKKSFMGIKSRICLRCGFRF